MIAAGPWSFADHAHDFDTHVRASIPGYTACHDVVAALARQVVRPGDHIVDLGCSTGTLTARLAQQHPTAVVTGVDDEPAMTDRAHRAPNLTYVTAQLQATPLPPTRARLVTAIFTLQFLPPEDRPLVLDRIRQRLQPGGLLVLAEKLTPRHGRLAHHLDGVVLDHKLAHELTPDEVISKTLGLRGVMHCPTRTEVEAELAAAGFPTHEWVWQTGPFAAIAAAA